MGKKKKTYLATLPTWNWPFSLQIGIRPSKIGIWRLTSSLEIEFHLLISVLENWKHVKKTLCQHLKVKSGHKNSEYMKNKLRRLTTSIISHLSPTSIYFWRAKICSSSYIHTRHLAFYIIMSWFFSSKSWGSFIIDNHIWV